MTTRRMRMNGTAKLIGVIVALVALVGTAVAVHVERSGQIEVNADRLVEFKTRYHEDLGKLEDGMAAIAAEVNRNGRVLAAMAVKLDLDVD